MLTKPIVRGCITKWAFALSKINLIYAPLKAVKGQAIIDLITKYPMVHVEEEKCENLIQVVLWTLHFDGSCANKFSGIGILIMSPRGHRTKFMFKLDFECLNKRAEYEG